MDLFEKCHNEFMQMVEGAGVGPAPKGSRPYVLPLH